MLSNRKLVAAVPKHWCAFVSETTGKAKNAVSELQPSLESMSKTVRHQDDKGCNWQSLEMPKRQDVPWDFQKIQSESINAIISEVLTGTMSSISDQNDQNDASFY